MDDLLKEFLTESSESLATLDVELVTLEQNPNDAATLSSIFRLVHTIKGTSGFLGLGRLGAVAHAGENVLGKFRDGALLVTPTAVTLILRCIDRIRSLLADLEARGTEPEGSDAELIAELDSVAEGKAQPPVDAPHRDPGGFPVAAELLAEVAAQIAGTKPAVAPPVEAVAHKEPVVEAKEPKDGAENRDTALAAASIRVNVSVLENLMTLVSELVLTRNQLLQMVRGRDGGEFKIPLQRLSHITSDLQEGVMKSRMQPIGNAWAKLPRVVRDLSLELGKKIELVMRGAETELDRQVLELIRDPLTHMVRNSADHGIETAADRRAAGKTENGTISLSAFHEGGHIVIVIADDGRGLNLDRIRAKALANGFVTEAELATMSEQQVLQLIFRAGLSTSEKVTAVSGRGVGMDVVRSNVERIGGTIELKSTPRAGTTFTIKIPLTLAIVSALVVAAGGQRFAIPQINVLELVRATAGSDTQIETIKNSPVLRLRDRLLPLVSLRQLLQLGEAATSENTNDLFIVVTQVGACKFGVIVDRVFDTEEIVVKPVSPMLRQIPFYSGNTILGDGSVIMILDPNGIATAAGQVQIGANEGNESASAAATQSERTAFLVFEAGGHGPKAVPLSLVERLEDIDLANVEHARGQQVIQYRGQLMPLVQFDPADTWRETGSQPVIVFADHGRAMGLVVTRIVDIVSDQMRVELTSDREGLLGSAIIAGRATDIIDTPHFLTRAFSDWFTEGDTVQAVRRVLLVDDSRFYRNLITPPLTAAGWAVTAAASGAEALTVLEAGGEFAAVAIDLRMPVMSGSALAKRLAGDPRWAAIPRIGLASETDAGSSRPEFAVVMNKADREGIVRALNEGRVTANAEPPVDLLRSA